MKTGEADAGKRILRSAAGIDYIHFRLIRRKQIFLSARRTDIPMLFFALSFVSSVMISWPLWKVNRASICLYYILLLPAIAATPGQTRAQNATIRGFVRDASDGQPLQGVNVVVFRDGALVQGAATDLDGLYNLRIPSGAYELRATYIGYRMVVDTLSLDAGEIRTYNLSLELDDARLDEVIVEGESETGGAASVSAGLQTIRPSDIEHIPAPDVSGDLASYLTTLPGVVSTGDQGGQFFVRGGEPTQNLVLIDGMPLYQPFHLLGFYSAFPSDIIHNTEVYAGGFGPRYGGHLSSVIDIATRNGNKQRFSGSASVAPFVAGAQVEGPLYPGRVSMLTSWRQSMIEQGAAHLIDRPLPYDFNDQFAKVHANLTPNSQLSVSGIRTFDRGAIGVAGDPTAGEDDVTWNNQAIGLRYLLLPASMPVFAEILLSTSSTRNEFGTRGDPSRSSSAQQFRASANLTHFLNLADVNWGLFIGTSVLESELGSVYQDLETDEEFITEAGAYLSPEFKVRDRLRIQPGLRVHAFPSKGRTFVEPRVRGEWRIGVHSLSGAWGLYHQEIVGLTDRRDAGDVFTAWAASPLVKVPQAMHVIGGYRVSPMQWLDFSLEGFYKKLHNLSIAEWTAFPRFTTRLQPADGRAIGFDVRVELDRRPFYGFVSYGFANVTYDARQQSVVYWFGELEKTFHPPHDRRHQVNAVAAMKVAGFDVNVRWQLGSGLPFSEALGFDRFILTPGPTDVLQEPGSLRVLYGEPYKGRLPAYHRLDVSLDRDIALSQRAVITLHAGVINAYDRANLFYLDLYTLRRVDQLPLIPSFGLKFSVR